MTVEEMKAVDIRTVDRDTLVDIRDVKIDRSLPLEERVRSSEVAYKRSAG